MLEVWQALREHVIFCRELWMVTFSSRISPKKYILFWNYLGFYFKGFYFLLNVREFYSEIWEFISIDWLKKVFSKTFLKL